jgi:hypothetical protein
MSNSYAQTRAEYRAIQGKAAELARALRKQGVRLPRVRHSQAYEIGARADLQSLPSYSKYGKGE